VTKCQTALIRLHRDMTEAATKLKAHPVYHTPGGKPAVAIAPGAPPHLDLGHGVGHLCPPSYAPNPAGGGFESTGVLSRKEIRDGGFGPLPVAVRDQLARFTAAKLAALVDMGSSMADTVGAANFSLWMAHADVRSRVLAVWLCGCVLRAVCACVGRARPADELTEKITIFHLMSLMRTLRSSTFIVVPDGSARATPLSCCVPACVICMCVHVGGARVPPPTPLLTPPPAGSGARSGRDSGGRGGGSGGGGGGGALSKGGGCG